MIRKFSLFLFPLLALSGCDTMAPIAKYGAYAAAGTGYLSPEAAAQIGQAADNAARDLTPKEEYFLGRSVAAQILARYPRWRNAEADRYVNLVGLSAAYASDRPEVYGGYHFTVLDTRELNGFAAPGGFVFLTRGTLAACGSEEELAAVLAHEVSHVAHRHGLDAIKTAQGAKILALVAQDLARRDKELREAIRYFDGLTDQIADTLINKGRSRSLEYEADRAGAACAARAGYDPRGMGSFLDRLSRAGGGAAAGGFFRTHPAPADRLQELRPPSAAPSRDPGRPARDARFAKIAALARR